jgi:effector-binding domain-containing protein
MIKIGDFSKLSRVTVKTLRYYDELDLLKPVQVDPFTGYRFYAAQQLLLLNRILALKDLGISLAQIKRLLKDGLPQEQMLGILRQRQVELEHEIEGSQAKMERVLARLRQFEQENSMSTVDVVMKSVPAITIASVRGKVPSYTSQDPLWEQLEMRLQQAGVKPIEPCFTIDHDKEYRETDHDLEVCEPISGMVKLPQPVEVRTLPAEKVMASLIHHGPFNTLTQSYQKMVKWLEENGYQISGPGREIYISTGEGPVKQDDPSYVVEIQFPVSKG